VRVAGIGFRDGTEIASLRAALDAAGGEVSALACVAEKAGEPVLQALAAELGVRVIAVPVSELKGVGTITQSERMLLRFGTGSLAEAAALCAAGPGAKLLGPRAASPDGMATAAIAERVTE
jgi:cobalt-precorrin 5A hydrolase